VQASLRFAGILPAASLGLTRKTIHENTRSATSFVGLV